MGVERNGTVRKLCLVHSIIASGHGRWKKNKKNKKDKKNKNKNGNWELGFGFSCLLQTFYLGRDL